jgi:hypothetical protein
MLGRLLRSFKDCPGKSNRRKAFYFGIAYRFITFEDVPKPD